MLDTRGILGWALCYFSAFQWRHNSPPMFPGDTVCASELCATRLAWYLSHSTHQFSCSYKQQTYADRGYHPPWVHHRCNPQIYYHSHQSQETNRFTYLEIQSYSQHNCTCFPLDWSWIHILSNSHQQRLSSSTAFHIGSILQTNPMPYHTSSPPTEVKEL